jgi:hypothetical protein
MAADRAGEYRALQDACREALAGEPADRVRALRRCRTEWRAVGRRDFFPPAERDTAAAALQDLAAAVGRDATGVPA